MARYKLTHGMFGQPSKTILDTETGNMIPMDEANTHYQEYLEWVAKGNIADLAGEPESLQTPEEAE